MSYFNELYQEVILDHNKRPRNFGELPGADSRANGNNPLCGDRLTVYLKLDGKTVTDVRFKGAGCAISTASASLMTEALKGKTVEEIEHLFARFRAMVTGKTSLAEEPAAKLGKLEVFRGVSDYPVRVKCATLAWHTMLAALRQSDETVSTE
ncbi:MAG: SUF system NifU family Fe-S cluster assembly protein [Acidobacteria bacterium]|nr:MAG: SUF system NifU family Fe-S cluster assembly protein [Acidobacteriota bacterium]